MLIKCIKNITFFVEWFIAQRFCRVVAFSLCYDCPIIQLRQTSFAFIRSINITRSVFGSNRCLLQKYDHSLTNRGWFFFYAKKSMFLLIQKTIQIVILVDFLLLLSRYLFFKACCVLHILCRTKRGKRKRVFYYFWC